MRYTRFVAVLTLLAVTGCAAQHPASPPASTAAPTLPAPGMFCPDLAAKGISFRVTNAKGYSIAAVEVGTGPNVVILAHQFQADLCQFLPFAEELSGKGYRAIAFSFAGSGASTFVSTDFSYVEDVAAIVRHARDTGAAKIVLVGASAGGTFSVAAAAAITPPVAGVVALSAPGNWAGIEGYNAAAKLTMPALVAAAEDDNNFAIDATAYAAALKPGSSTLVIVPGWEHGVSLLDPGSTDGAAVRTALFAFLARHLGA